MIAIYIYFVTLFIAPQLWIHPFIGWKTDYLCFPLMALAICFTKNLTEVFRLKIVDALIVSFVIWITISAIANGWTPESQAQVIFYWKMVVMFKLMVAILENTERTKKAVIFFCIIAGILGVEAIYHKLSADGIGWAGQKLGWVDPAAIEEGVKGRSRWIGILGGQGVFAVIFHMAVAFPLCAYKYKKSVLLRGFLLAFIGLMISALYCTGSRGGFIAMIAVFGVYYLIRRKFSFISIILCISFVVLLLLLAPSYLTTIRDQSRSSQYRVEMWAAGLDMIKNNPLFGVGIHNYKEYTGRLIAHNSAIEIMGETGLFGICLWISILYYNFKCLIIKIKETLDDSIRWFYVALFLTLMGYLISSMFVTLEYETYYIILAWCTAIHYKDSNISLNRWDFLKIGCIIIGFISVIQIFAIIFLG